MAEYSYSGKKSESMPGSCTLIGSDPVLTDALYKNKKNTEPSAFGIELMRNRVHSTEIPVSMADCVGLKGTVKGDLIFDEERIRMPTACQIRSIHAHNTEDKNPAFHVHLTCSETSDEVLDYLTRLVDNSRNLGRDLCLGRRPYTKAETSRASRLDKCLHDCIRSKSRSKQTQMMMF